MLWAAYIYSLCITILPQKFPIASRDPKIETDVEPQEPPNDTRKHELPTPANTAEVPSQTQLVELPSAGALQNPSDRDKWIDGIQILHHQPTNLLHMDQLLIDLRRPLQ